MWRYQDFYSSPVQVATCFTWTANSYTSWSFPDPTFSGLFPELTNVEIKYFLDVADSWRKQSCDTSGLSNY